MDTIKKFSKSKGFESLPRELLQSKEISLEAIGLLCNLQSYPDNWVLHKTELRKRFLNKEKVVDRIWDELVAHGYILQFRKRVGKKYSYQYFFNVSKFTVEETQELLEGMFSEGMMLYHKAMKPVKGEPLNLTPFIFLSEEDKNKLDLSFWTSQNGNLNKTDETNDSSSSQYGKSNMEFPNTEGSKLTNNKLTTKMSDNSFEKLDDEEKKYKRVNQLIETDSEFASTTRFLISTGLNMDLVIEIMTNLSERKELLIPELIVDQIKWCIDKNQNDGIGDFVKYFITGLEMRYGWFGGTVNQQDTDQYYSETTGKDIREIKIPMHNWADV